MTYNAGLALEYVKARFEYLSLPKEKEEYTLARIQAAAGRLCDNGIELQDTPQDLMLLVDMTVWETTNRDKPGSMPQWLIQVRRERFLHDGAARRRAQEGGGACC